MFALPCTVLLLSRYPGQRSDLHCCYRTIREWRKTESLLSFFSELHQTKNSPISDGSSVSSLHLISLRDHFEQHWNIYLRPNLSFSEVMSFWHQFVFVKMRQFSLPLSSSSPSSSHIRDQYFCLFLSLAPPALQAVKTDKSGKRESGMEGLKGREGKLNRKEAQQLSCKVRLELVWLLKHDQPDVSWPVSWTFSLKPYPTFCSIFNPTKRRSETLSIIGSLRQMSVFIHGLD